MIIPALLGEIRNDIACNVVDVVGTNANPPIARPKPDVIQNDALQIGIPVALGPVAGVLQRAAWRGATLAASLGVARQRHGGYLLGPSWRLRRRGDGERGKRTDHDTMEKAGR